MAGRLTTGGRKKLNLFSEKDMRPSYVIRIATEGQKTEYMYFKNCFENKSSVLVLDILPAKDNKSDPASVLHRLLDSVNPDSEPVGEKSSPKTRRADEYWLVVDVDQFKKLPSIIQKAHDMGIKTAVSNLCFEIWLLMYSTSTLHADLLKELDTDVADDLVQKLKKYDKNYQKGQLNETRYVKHKRAITNAKKLDTNKSAEIPDRPGTQVYKLVEVILDRLQRPLGNRVPASRLPTDVRRADTD